MILDSLQQFSINFPYLFIPLVLILAYILFRITKFFLARFSYFVALRTETIYDDLFVDQLQPFRFSWLAPITLIYYFADGLFPQYAFIKITALIFIVWLLTDFLISILSGINDVYKNNPRYTGLSVAGYIGLIKILLVVGAIILTISQLTDIDPLTLLSGAGAWLAVLLLIFRDTILSFLASIQISTQKLIKEGDTVDIPAFGANGAIIGIDLQTITIQNFDNTVTSIPTSRIIDTGFKNYRVMLESGYRRLKRSLLIDVETITIIDQELLKQLKAVDFINAQIGDALEEEPGIKTNLQFFMKYVQGYLKGRKEVRQKKYPLIVRTLEPSPFGIPMEIYLFVKADGWEAFEEIQSDVILHLVAVLPYFNLKIPKP